MVQLPGASATLILENVVLRGSPGIADWLPSGQRNGGQGSALAVSPCMSVPMCLPSSPLHAQLTLSRPSIYVDVYMPYFLHKNTLNTVPLCMHPCLSRFCD
jgi:hypothetical protein